MSKNSILCLFLDIFILLSCNLQQERRMKSMEIVDELINIFDKPELKDGDVIIMTEQGGEKIKHAAIYSSSDLYGNKNIISSVVSGISVSNLKNFLNYNNCSFKIFRFDPKIKNHLDGDIIRKNIINQAKFWYNKVNMNRNFYRNEDYYFHLSLKYSLNNQSKLFSIYNSFKNNESAKLLNLLLYLKYSIRQKTLPSINKGFTCSGFILACIGNAFINDVIEQYAHEDISLLKKNSIWPSLKYGNISQSDSNYNKAVDLLKQNRIISYDKDKYKEYLSIEHPSLNISNMDNFLNLPKKIKVEKISMEDYLKSKGISISKIIVKMENRLNDLKLLNIKISTLEDIYKYFKKNSHIWEEIL